MGRATAHVPACERDLKRCAKTAASGYNEARASCAESCTVPIGDAAKSRKISRKKEPRVRIRERPGRVLVPSAHRARGIAAHGRGLPTRSGGLPRLPRTARAWRASATSTARRWPPSNAASWSRTSPSPPCAGASPPCAATTGSLCARGSPMRTRPTPWTFPRPPTGCGRAFHRGSGRDAGRLRGRAPERLARPGAFGSALRLRAARQRDRGARYGGRQLRRRLPARVRQGIQGAHRAHCRRGPSARCAGI